MVSAIFFSPMQPLQRANIRSDASSKWMILPTSGPKDLTWVPPKPSTRTWWYSDLKTRNVLCKPFTKKNVLSILIDIVWMCGRHQGSREELEWSMHLCALGHLSYPANGLYKLTNPDALIWLQEQCCFPTYWLIRIYHTTPDAPTCNLYRDRSCCACALSNNI